MVSFGTIILRLVGGFFLPLTLPPVMFRSIGVVISAMVIFSSCEKAISFTPNSAGPVVVVEATIEDGQPPVVILSKSLDYFSEITPELLAGSFINNAEIDVSNGTLTHRLKEYFINTPDGYKLYYYSIDSSNLGTAFLGELAKSYSLRINTGGKEYTATTTIPALAKTIDSLWWQKSSGYIPQAKCDLSTRSASRRKIDNRRYRN